MEDTHPLHVAFFMEHDLEKVKYTMKHLACRLAVKPLHVHVFLRTGRDAYGYILNKKQVAKLAEMRQYLFQTQQTFRAIKAVGGLSFEEVRQNKTEKDCLEDYMLQLREADSDFRFLRLENDTWDDPWRMPG